MSKKLGFPDELGADPSEDGTGVFSDMSVTPVGLVRVRHADMACQYTGAS